MARSNRSVWLATAITVALILGLPAGAAAQSKAAFGAWLASASNAPESSKWGRLTLKDGVLTFATSSIEWQKPLNEIKRVAQSKRADRTIEIEAYNGDVLFVSILGQQMVIESPRRALHVIERAVRTAPAARPAITVAAAGGGSSNQ